MEVVKIAIIHVKHAMDLQNMIVQIVLMYIIIKEYKNIDINIIINVYYFVQ